MRAAAAFYRTECQVTLWYTTGGVDLYRKRAIKAFEELKQDFAGERDVNQKEWVKQAEEYWSKVRAKM